MKTNENLKLTLKKSTKLKNSLKRARIACNEVIYTEQNTEELNEVKAFIEYKIDLLDEITTLINKFLKNQWDYKEAEFLKTLDLLKEQFNAVSNNARLFRLQKMYTRKINEELIDL